MKHSKSSLIMKNLIEHGTSSVSNLSAQSVVLCNQDTSQAFDYGAVMKLVGTRFNSSNAVYAMVEVMFLSGCRVSQVLNILPRDVMPNLSIVIKGMKGGDAVRVVPIMSREFWKSYASKTEQLSSIYSRFYMYRQFKLLGLYYIGDKDHNNSVTHCFRVSAIKSTKNAEITETERSRMFGHHSNKSQKYYLENGKKRI